MRKFAVFIAVAFVFASCKPVAKALYGIKKPRVETDESIQHYLRKKDVESNNLYVFKDIKSFAYASEMGLLSIPDAMFFNSKKQFVPYRESSSSCNANVDKFLVDLHKINEMAADTTKSFADLTSMLRPLTGRRSADPKVLVVITWTTYAGRLNKEKAFEWVNLIKTAQGKGVDVDYVMLNCDFNRSWGLTDEQWRQVGIR